ncbi:MAG: hypothetical protein Q9208_006303 [Pyrenodesmia sp. 3 TL-2023]
MPGPLHKDSSRSLSSCHSSSTLDNPIDIPTPSSDFPAQVHEPRWPQPPSSALDAHGLKERKKFADRVRTQHRNISPRLLRFILDFGEKCSRYVTGHSKNKEEDLATIETNDAMLHSRWDFEEGGQGLWQGILDVMDAFTEHRMAADYGDDLAVTTDENRGPDPSWKGMKWTEVARLMGEEEKKMRIWRQKNEGQQWRTLGQAREPRSEKPDTPILDDVQKAANERHILASQVAYEIREYGKRNEQCHSGVRDLINNAFWQELAELIVRDKKTLGRIYQNNPQAQKSMRQCITNLQRQWFDVVYSDDNGHVRFVPTDNANARTKRVTSDLRRVGGQWSLAAQGALQVDPMVNGVGRIALPPPSTD